MLNCDKDNNDWLCTNREFSSLDRVCILCSVVIKNTTNHSADVNQQQQDYDCQRAVYLPVYWGKWQATWSSPVYSSNINSHRQATSCSVAMSFVIRCWFGSVTPKTPPVLPVVIYKQLQQSLINFANVLQATINNQAINQKLLRPGLWWSKPVWK